MTLWRAFALPMIASCALWAEEWTFWIQPCTPELARKAHCKADDPQLGKWALEAWSRESAGGLTFRESATQEHARLRIHWADAQASLYGEAVPIFVDGKRGADIYVLPDTGAREDPLLRDAIVYLTCVHEAGHGIGLQHTAAFADIMYSFRYGGDIVEYFGRYRRLLAKRDDMARHSGISDDDRLVLRTRYPASK